MGENYMIYFLLGISLAIMLFGYYWFVSALGSVAGAVAGILILTGVLFGVVLMTAYDKAYWEWWIK